MWFCCEWRIRAGLIAVSEANYIDIGIMRVVVVLLFCYCYLRHCFCHCLRHCRCHFRCMSVILWSQSRGCSVIIVGAGRVGFVVFVIVGGDRGILACVVFLVKVGCYFDDGVSLVSDFFL